VCVLFMGFDAVFIFSVRPMAIVAGLNASVDNTCTTGMKCMRNEGKFNHMKFHARSQETSRRIFNGRYSSTN
jgi:hypothetical protein